MSLKNRGNGYMVLVILFFLLFCMFKILHGARDRYLLVQEACRGEAPWAVKQLAACWMEPSRQAEPDERTWSLRTEGSTAARCKYRPPHPAFSPSLFP